MTDLIDQEKPALEALAEELQALVIEYRFDDSMRRLEAKHRIGETVHTSVFWQKYARGSALALEAVANASRISISDLYRCLQFYESYPKLDIAVATLKGDKKTLTWTDVKGILGGNNPKEIKEPKCKKCLIHCL